MTIKKEIHVTASAMSPKTAKIWLKIVSAVLLVMFAVNAGAIIHYNVQWKNRPTVSAEVVSVYKEDVGKKCRIIYVFEDDAYENEVKYAAFSFAKAGKHINIKVNPDRPRDVYYPMYNIDGLVFIDMLMGAWCGLFLWAIIKSMKNNNGSFYADDLDNTKNTV